MLPKNFIKASAIFSLLFIVSAFPLLAQQEIPIEDIDLSQVFTSIGLLTAAVLSFTSLTKKVFKSKDSETIIWSGVVSVLLGAAGWLLKIGIFAGVEWWYILIYSAAAMLLSNGLSTWPLISGVLTILKLKVPKY